MNTATLPGIEERITGAGIRVVRLHYTADPAKRSEEWKAGARAGYTSERDWLREMEVDWTVAAGLPVYGEEFMREWHVAKEPLLAIAGMPMRRSWDNPLKPACVFWQIDASARFNVLREHVIWDGRGPEKQMGMERFADEVKILSNDWYPGMEFLDYGDPSCWSKSQTDEKSNAEILRAKGIFLRPGPMTFTDRKSAIDRVLAKSIGGRPQLMVSPECTMLIEGFVGAYKYEQIGDTEKYKETVEKNAWSHPMNALEYGIGAIVVQTPREDEPGTRREERYEEETSRTRAGVWY